MTCRTLRESIVETARCGDAGLGTQAAVEGHLEQCAACRALMARERQLSLGLRALAAATADDGPPDVMGRRLEALFTEWVASTRTVPSTTALPPSAASSTIRARWLSIAAAIVMIATAVAWWGSRAHERAVTDVAPIVAAVVPVDTPQRPAFVKTREPQKAAVRVGSSRSTRAQRRVVASPVKLAVAQGFVELPGAAGLPDFESGQIVRVEIPLTSLPTYGIDIAPDARDEPVEADMLVGQDGQARAIRLVPTAAGR